MSVYLVILFLTFLFGLIGMYTSHVHDVVLIGSIEKRRLAGRIGVIGVLIVYVFFFAVRWNVGTDFANYYHRYNLIGVSNYKDIIGIRDWGFYLLTWFLYRVAPGNYIFYGAVIGILIYLPVLFTYRKFSNNFILTCSLYVMLCMYMWPYNGTRQSIAVSIMFSASPLLFKKKQWWKFCICATIAALFHATALIVLPFMFLAKYRPWSKSIIFGCIAIGTSILILPRLWNSIISFLMVIGQIKMAEDYSNYEILRSGINVLRIIVAALPVIISFCYYDTLKANNSQIDVSINMCLLNLVMLIGAFQITTLARFSQYFNLYQAILIPDFVNLFRKEFRMIAMVAIVLLYFLHMIVLLPRDSGLLPYVSIFNQ